MALITPGFGELLSCLRGRRATISTRPWILARPEPAFLRVDRLPRAWWHPPNVPHAKLRGQGRAVTRIAARWLLTTVLASALV